MAISTFLRMNLENIAVLALAASFLIVLFHKFGFWDWLNTLFSVKWFTCFFCMGFWLVFIGVCIYNYMTVPTQYYNGSANQFVLGIVFKSAIEAALAAPLIAFITYVITVNDGNS